MSTVILEVEEKQREALLELLEKIPGVRVVNRQPAAEAKPAYWNLLGKYKHTNVSSESLAAANEEDKRMEGA